MFFEKCKYITLKIDSGDGDLLRSMYMCKCACLCTHIAYHEDGRLLVGITLLIMVNIIYIS